MLMYLFLWAWQGRGLVAGLLSALVKAKVRVEEVARTSFNLIRSDKMSADSSPAQFACFLCVTTFEWLLLSAFKGWNLQ